MSLINDALKRARQSQQKNLPPGAPSLPPIEFGSRSNIGWILPLAITTFIAAAFFFIGLAMSKRTMTKIVTSPEISATQQTASVSAPAIISNTPQPAAATAPPTTVVVSPPAPSAITRDFSPELKLQGILYNPAQPSAIVNGRNVGIGDRIGEFRVKTISKYTVTLTGPDGKENVLAMGD